jgi:hypothetical protein
VELKGRAKEKHPSPFGISCGHRTWFWGQRPPRWPGVKCREYTVDKAREIQITFNINVINAISPDVEKKGCHLVALYGLLTLTK